MTNKNTESHLAPGHRGRQDQDCCGVDIEQLLAGQESECAECERELCDMRTYHVGRGAGQASGFTVASELDRLIAWPLVT